VCLRDINSHHSAYYSAPGRAAEYCEGYACLPYIELGTKYSAHAACGRGYVIHWHCSAATGYLLLILWMTSFAHNRPGTTTNGLFSRTTWVSRYQKGKTSLDLNKARDYGVFGCRGISWTNLHLAPERQPH